MACPPGDYAAASRAQRELARLENQIANLEATQDQWEQAAQQQRY
jgi:hypothetical protein